MHEPGKAGEVRSGKDVEDASIASEIRHKAMLADRVCLQRMGAY